MTALRSHRLLSATAVLASLSVALTLTACGSGSSSHATTSAAATTTATSSGFAQQRAAIAACLRKYGITLPTQPRTSTTPPPGTTTTPRSVGVFGGAFGGAFAGNTKVRAALQNCGITLSQRPTTTNRVHDPAFQKAVNSYAACMQKNGYTLPKPNFSGSGPVFSTKQVNRNDPKFKSANAKCQQLLTFIGTRTTGG